MDEVPITVYTENGHRYCATARLRDRKLVFSFGTVMTVNDLLERYPYDRVLYVDDGLRFGSPAYMSAFAINKLLEDWGLAERPIAMSCKQRAERRARHRRFNKFVMWSFRFAGLAFATFAAYLFWRAVL